MKAKFVAVVFFALSGTAGVPAAGYAQEATRTLQAQGSSRDETKSETSKQRKIWTDDDLSSLRTAADKFVIEKEEEEAKKAAEAARAALPCPNKTRPAAAAPPGGPPALTDPKSADEADKMIAWESRDIQAQEETVARTQKELDAAPPDQREALRKTLQELTQTLEETRKEAQVLQLKKESLLNPPPTGSNPAAENTHSK